MSASSQVNTRDTDSLVVITAKRDGSEEDTKSVRKMSEVRSGKKAVGKGDARYWLQTGKLFADPRCRGSLTCKIQVNGQRESFPLRTSNKATAATKAARIYGDIVALGWSAALVKHKPETVKTEKPATIGQWAETVKATAGFRDSTFTTYLQSLRQIASEIEAIGDQPAVEANGEVRRDEKGRIIYRSRFDYRAGGRAAWLAKVDALPLALFHAAAVQRWKLNYIAKAGASPEARRRAENSAATLLRCARSLFSAKARKFAAAELKLPDPLPFAGVELPKRGSTSYQSKIDATRLIASARTELEGEPFKIFTLGLLCGLRKREIDLLTWGQVDFDKGLIRIERTEYFTPKSEDSVGEVDLDPETLALLRGWKATTSGTFVVHSKRPPRHDASRVNYRCTPHFDKLYTWLKLQGITARKPLHELRKELGALLASNQGIFAAQSVLRHAQISTTAAYYTDKKRRITAGLGSLLAGAAANIIEIQFTPNAGADDSLTGTRLPAEMKS